MKTLAKIGIFALSVLFIFSSCQKEEDEMASRPTLNADKGALFLEPNRSETITVSISAAGKIKSITAEAELGEVEIVSQTGIGVATGTLVIDYKSPINEAEDKIKVVVTDQLDQKEELELSVEVKIGPPTTISAGNVEGVWERGRTYIVQGDIIVPAGKSLLIEEGVTIIVDGDGSQGAPEIVVKGSIYSEGTKENPIIFTIPENRRTKENIFKGMWGGVICVSTTTEAFFNYTTIEFAGAPAGAASETVSIGELDEGDYRYALYFENEQGKLVFMNGRVAFTPDDAFVLNGGQILVSNNQFEYNGRVGGESMNVNSGVVGDIAFNVFFRPATNGVKWDNKGGKSPQTDVNIYNNTIIGGGWRQEKSGRGGSLNVQRDGRGKVYNNLIVNCRFGVRLREDQLPDLENVFVGYNFHFGNKQEIVDQFYPTAGLLIRGERETEFDVAGEVNENNPDFVNFDISTFTLEQGRSHNVEFLTSEDFKLKSDSPALKIGKTSFQPKISSMSINGGSVNAPEPAEFAGAFGN